MIKQAQSFEAYSAAEENAIEQDIFRVYDEIASAKYRSGIKCIGESMLLSDSTKVFMVPDQTKGTASLEDFHVITSNGLLLHAVYGKPMNIGVDECNIWGCYYYMEALVRMIKGTRGYW